MENRGETNPPTAAPTGGRDRNDTPNLGDADAVEKTTYASDVHGADAEGDRASRTAVTASVSHDRGLGPLGWAALVLAALVILAYAAGVLG